MALNGEGSWEHEICDLGARSTKNATGSRKQQGIVKWSKELKEKSKGRREQTEMKRSNENC